MARNPDNLRRAAADAGCIAFRLLTTEETLADLAAEYGVSESTIGSLYREHSTAEERRAAFKKKRWGEFSQGPAARVRRDAEQIVARLLAGDTSVTGIMREYGCAWQPIAEMYRSRTTAEQRRLALRKALDENPQHRKGWFRKGQVPFNKGRKGIHLSPATEFKPGCMRGAAARKYRAIGAITIRVDSAGHSYRYVKVRDDGAPQFRWEQYSRHLWKKLYGPIPHGHRVMHRDGDTQNDEPSNLICLSGRAAVAHQRTVNPQFCARQSAGMKRAWERRRKELAARAALPADPLLAGLIRRNVHECLNCGHETEPRERPPATCPKCSRDCWAKARMPRRERREPTLLERLGIETAA